MLACQMSQSEEGMARFEAMCVFVFQFSIYFFIITVITFTVSMLLLDHPHCTLLFPLTTPWAAN